MSQEYTPVFYHNFIKSFDVRSFEQKIACDGNVYRDCRGLTIDSNRYSTIVPPGDTGLLDHIKWLAFLCKSYQVCEGEFVYEACMSAQQIISPQIVPPVYRNRIRNIGEDHRLCSSGLVVYDEENMITAKILFTNDWIYGYYERRPGYKTGWGSNMAIMGDYASFTAIIPLCKRGLFNPISIDGCVNSSLNDFVRIGIGIDPCRGTIKYYVNRKEMYCVPRIGYRLADEYQVSELGGLPYLVTPGCIRFGFGNFSFMDHNMPNNYARQHVLEQLDSNGYPVHRLASGLAQLLPTNRYREPYPDFTGEYTSINPNISFAYNGTDPNMFNFGQGMIARIKYIAGYVVNTRTKMYKMLCNKAFVCNQEHSESEYCDCSNHCSESTLVEYDDDIYGPIPQPNKITRPFSVSHKPFPCKSSTETRCSTESKPSLGDMLRTMNTRTPHTPLYKEFPIKSKPSREDSYNKSRGGYINSGLPNSDVESTDYDDSNDSTYQSNNNDLSLGDLYRRSRSRRFTTKGDNDEGNGLVDENELESVNQQVNPDTESIAFACGDMTLNI
ncbi:Hypothetical protein HVR_LOCUS1033 [uncultured virus]|nr:Hypothetical protein HVR_LOCUS1033 [uncultured virus]